MTDHLSFYNPYGANLAPLYNWPAEGPTGAVSDWGIVGYSPRDVTYFDDGREAIDLTNWQAILDSLDTDTESADCEDDGDWYHGPAWDLPLSQNGLGRWDREYGYGRATVLLVRLGTDSERVVRGLLDRLADYPLLNESAYFELENAAWMRAWEDWARKDVVASFIESLTIDSDATPWDGSEDWCDDWATALIESREWDRCAHDAMSHWHGLTGEYDHDGAVAGLTAWVHGVIGALDTMVWVSRPLAGILPLPFADA